MQHDSTLISVASDTLTIGGVLAFIMKFTPFITAAVLLTALTLNILRIIDWFKNRKNANTKTRTRTKG
jgi:hypothetical protein